jgi:hypothetical protein
VRCGCDSLYIAPVCQLRVRASVIMSGQEEVELPGTPSPLPHASASAAAAGPATLSTPMGSTRSPRSSSSQDHTLTKSLFKYGWGELLRVSGCAVLLCFCVALQLLCVVLLLATERKFALPAPHCAIASCCFLRLSTEHHEKIVLCLASRVASCQAGCWHLLISRRCSGTDTRK